MVKIETTSVFSSRVRIRKLASSLNLTSIEAAILQKMSKPLGFFFCSSSSRIFLFLTIKQRHHQHKKKLG